MDSLSQIVLGASVASAIIGKSHGRKAALIGAICGTIPDLDVFIPLGDDVSNFTYHRGFSHSLLFCVLFAPIFVFALSKIKWFQICFGDLKAHLAVFLALFTHALLDAMTIYGTQIFWPSSMSPIGVGSVFIIDPLYTIPFLVCLVWFLCNKSIKPVVFGLIISTSYLLWSYAAQTYVYNIAKDQVAGQMLVQPTAFNTILWRVVSVEDDQYHVGYYSIFDKNKEIEFQTFENLKNDLLDTSSVNRLKWFTKGMYAVRREGDSLILSDIRMGLEPNQYVFQFDVSVEPAVKFQVKRDMNRLNDILQRMFRDF